MSKSLVELERELERFPTTVLHEFRRAAEIVSTESGKAVLDNWAKQGIEIAQQTVRSWEAASEYFRVSPHIVHQLSTSQILEWGRSGSALCNESPTIAIAFFRASPIAISYLRPHLIQDWAALGKTFYKGTWKSGTLAAKFFEVSAALLEHMNYHELEQFASFVEALSSKSVDLAAECLILGQQVLPQMRDHRLPFITMARALVDNNWREAKECFESAPGMFDHVWEGHRARFLGFATLLAQGGMTSIKPFLNQAARSLGSVDEVSQGYLLDMAETLLPVSYEAVADFLHSGPVLLEKISHTQLPAWIETGVGIIRENHDAGLAYFKLESNTSEEALESLSSAIDLGRVRDVLQLYCRALAGSDVSIATTSELLEKNIGWVFEGHATTEGTSIFLPPIANQYNSKDENFCLLKVVSTHQVAHIEFGSFGFSFETPAARFRDSRRARELQMSQPDTTSPGEPADEGSDFIQAPSLEEEDVVSAERGFLTDMGRFFNLFENRVLAKDIFTAVEDGRLDYRIKVEYPGLAPDYRRIQLDTLNERPDIEQMPLQEAMIEFLVRLSLQQNKGLQYPQMLVEQAKAIAQITRRLQSINAIVEDSGEATIRIYNIIDRLPNVQIPEEHWTETDFDQPDLSEQALEQLLDQLQDQPLPNELPPEEQDYDSPPEVDFRGDFKPELTQLMSTLRDQRGQQEDIQGTTAISEQMLEDVLANSAELDLDEQESDQNAIKIKVLVKNLMQEMSHHPPSVPGQGFGDIPHQDEQGGELEASEPRTFVYDEWDFRAADYKPRWCIVREKIMAEGDPQFYMDTLQNHSSLIRQIRREFELLTPETYRKIKHLPDGDDFDLDAVIESIIDKRAGISPSDKVHWRRSKIEREVAVVFLLDMSASTAEAIEESRRMTNDWDAPDDPAEYMAWLQNRRGQGERRSHKRIIDLERESIVLLINALETIGDTYGIYGFSGYGRENVEFYVIKDLEETFSERIKRRIDKVSPLHATRMGPAIRHVTTKLERLDARTKLMFLISDGRPQDRGYSREGVEKEYAVHDTKMALTEARQKNITPFCLTVDKAGHDYLKTMCQDMGYEVLNDISTLPSRLPMLYRKLAF